MLVDSDFCCNHFELFSCDASFHASVSHTTTNAQLLGCTLWSSLRWHYPVVFYQTSVYLLSKQQQLYISSVLTSIQLYYMFRLYFSHHQVEILFHKNSKRGEASPDKHWVKSCGKIYDYYSENWIIAALKSIWDGICCYTLQEYSSVWK
jgi:hypothetical protein